MGSNTTNSYFWKPSLGASGATELALFDAALDATDLIIKDLVDNKQPLDAGLTSIAGLTTATDKMIYTTALDTYAVASLTAFARSILDDADEATFKATLGLVIGTNVQAFDNALTSISGLTYVSASFIKLTANDTYAVRTLAQTRTDISAAASGANADITSMTGLSNDGIPLAKVANAASDGGNSDITALTGLTTALGANYGGTGVLNNALNTITFTGNYTLGLTLTANTGVTLPTSGTLAVNNQTFYIGTTQVAINRASAGLTLAGITLTTPELGAATATSINFGDTSLNYYKEGSWTPALKFGGNSVNMTYTTQAGFYTKIGRQVTLTCYMLLSAKGDSNGNASITGLPFTNKNSDGAYVSITLWLSDITFADFPMGYLAKNSALIVLNEITNAGVRTDLTDADFANNSSMLINVTYFVD